MNKKCLYALFISISLVVWGCSQTINEEDAGRQGEEILLSSLTSQTVSTDTRAVSDFPNNGSIGVVATTSVDPTNPQNNWNTYTDISNAEARATSESGGVFNFTWTETKYWPFDGSNLYFMAYSPAPKEDLNYFLSTDNTSLFIGLSANTPDVMFASNNSTFQAYNKNSGVVNLGEFRHILSKLTIQVVADAGMSETIVISNLSVSTPMRSGSYQLFGGDNGLTVQSADVNYVATLASGNVGFKSQPFTNTMFLFPGTQDDVEVSITLVDTSNSQSYTGNYMVSFFTNSSNEPILLERAKNTVLTINVHNIGVEDPNRNIQLEGTLKDWNYQGNFGISIN